MYICLFEALRGVSSRPRRNASHPSRRPARGGRVGPPV